MASKEYPGYDSAATYSHLYGAHQQHYGGPQESYGAPHQQQPVMMVEESALPSTKEEEHTIEEPPAGLHAAHRKRNFILWLVRYAGVIIVIALALVAPVIVYRNDADQSNDDDQTLEQRQYNNLIYYLFLWLFITWLCACGSDIIALMLPYLFRFIARYVNPAQMKYWRFLRAMRRPITLLGLVFSSFVAFDSLIPSNEYLSVNFNKDPDTVGWDDIIDQIFFLCALWTGFYFVEKIAILYMTIHYHYRTNLKKITRSKEIQNALIALYDASLYLNPVGSGAFKAEDALIRNAKGLATGSDRTRVTTYLSRMGIDSYGMTSFFGNFFSEDPKSHWFRPASSYAVVERAIAQPPAAAALAKRIWMSFVVHGSDALTAGDISEVLGPYQADKAKEIFKVLDVNESGDLRLDEFVWTVVEAGHERHMIYQGMSNADHLINTFDWVCLTILAAVMVFFILVTYVPEIKQIQQTLSFIAIGLSFAVGRSFNHFLVGVMFVFFDHPFDIGDKIEIYNLASSISTPAFVTKQSILYTCFRRVDNGTELQISNERLAQKRLENYTRSGLNRQALSIFVDHRTSFKDIMYLKSELLEFLKDDENKRDYQPDLGMSIVNLHEGNKMEIKLNFGHKSNWSNEKLRATRSNRFMCALVAAMRKVPIYRPLTMNGVNGDPDKPIYYAMVDDKLATDKIAKGKATRASNRYDAPKKHPDSERNSVTERNAAADEAAQQAAAKAAVDAAAEEGAFSRMTAIPSFPGEDGVRGTSSGVDVERMLPSGATGLRMVSNSGGHMYTQ